MFTRLLFVSILLALLAVSALAQEAPMAGPTAAQAKGYRMWPGDEVTGKVLGETDFDFVSTVSEDGTIAVPFDATPIVAKCRTEDEVKADVSKLLGKYLKSPMFQFRVTDRKSRPPATISGEVNAPQQVILYRKVTLLELLSVAGGAKEEAGGTVQVFRTQPPTCADDKSANWLASDTTGVPSRIYNLSEVRVAGDKNPVIYPGDVVIVQKAAPVYITGEIANPQGVYIKEGGLTLHDAIAKLGGVRREAKTKDIKIYRLKPNSTEREVISANYELIRKGQQKDIQLQPYDIVEVDKAKDSIAKMIMDIAIGAGKSTIGAVTQGVGYRVMY
jgi:polysaccharide export outer membrane protein